MLGANDHDLIGYTKSPRSSAPIFAAGDVTQVPGEARTTGLSTMPTGAATSVDGARPGVTGWTGTTLWHEDRRRHERGKWRYIVPSYQNLRTSIASIATSALIVIILSDRWAAISPRYAAKWPVPNGAEALFFYTICG